MFGDNEFSETSRAGIISGSVDVASSVFEGFVGDCTLGGAELPTDDTGSEIEAEDEGDDINEKKLPRQR